MSLKRSRTHELHDGPIKALAFGHDRIATGGSDGKVHLLTGDGERLATAHVHSDLVNDVAVAPGGHIASVSRDRRVRLWAPEPNRSYTVGEHDHWSMCVTWSPDRGRLATGSEDGTIRLWDPDGGAVNTIDLGRPINGIDWKGSLIAAASGDGTLYLLDGGGSVVRRFPKAGQMLWDTELDAGGERVAWVGRDRHLRIAPVDGEEVTIPAHTDQIWGVSWDGDRLLTAAADGTVAVWGADGSAVERIDVGPWARKAVVAHGAIFVATEDGELVVFEDDGTRRNGSEPVAVPEQPAACVHWDPEVGESDASGCEECGSSEQMRLCVTCGYVGCCESQLAHGTKHWLETGHPNTIPHPTRDHSWKWCYADDMYVKQVADD